MSTTTRQAVRIIAGVRFTKGADEVYRAEAFGRSLWAWNGGTPGDAAWHWGFAPKSTTGQGLGEDRNKGTRGTREDAMREALAWAEARQAPAQAAAEGAALADAEMQAKGYQAGAAVAEHRAELAEAPAYRMPATVACAQAMTTAGLAFHDARRPAYRAAFYAAHLTGASDAECAGQAGAAIGLPRA